MKALFNKTPEVRNLENKINDMIGSFLYFVGNSIFENYTDKIIEDNIDDVAEFLVEINKEIKKMQALDYMIYDSLSRQVVGYFGFIDMLKRKIYNLD